MRSCLRSFIDEAGVPPAVIVGLSGGADSLALTLTVIDVASRAGIEVVTLTVDHGLRAGSAHEARRVADLAASLGARALVETVRVDGRGGPEASARDARLAALRSLALREGAPVLLGHTMDDQAETVLLRLARGSGPSSLRAIAPVRRDEDGVTWLRPLLGLRRADTAGACAQAALTPLEDPTNAIDGPWRAADGSALRRSAVRHSAIPALASALGVDPVPALARTAALCAADDDALREWTRGLLAVSCEASPAAGEGSLALVVSEVSGAPRAVRARALREVARRALPSRSETADDTQACRGLVAAIPPARLHACVRKFVSGCRGVRRAHAGSLGRSERASVTTRCCADSENRCLLSTNTCSYGTLIVQPLAERR